MTTPATSNGHTRLAYILGVPLAPDCQRQWPQLGEVAAPEWRRALTDRLTMPADGIWKDAQHLSHY
jgi:hypothetical protein